MLLCDHSTVGSFGLIVNKPLELTPDAIDFGEVANPNLSLRSGGPMQQDQLLLVHTAPASSDEMLSVAPSITLGGSLNFLEEATQGSDPLLLCFGYGAWGAGVLEREFLSAGWFLTPASPHYLFNTPPEALWHTLLKDMGGKYASLAQIPTDPFLN